MGIIKGSKNKNIREELAKAKLPKMEIKHSVLCLKSFHHVHWSASRLKGWMSLWLIMLNPGIHGNCFLHAPWGYDGNRNWIEWFPGIWKTLSPKITWANEINLNYWKVWILLQLILWGKDEDWLRFYYSSVWSSVSGMDMCGFWAETKLCTA